MWFHHKNHIFKQTKKPEKPWFLGLSLFRTRQESNLRPFGPEPNALSPELRVLM